MMQDDLISKIRSSIESEPENTALHLSLAKSLVEAIWANTDMWDNYLNEAKSIYENILITSPSNEIALVNLGTVLCDQGRHQSALEIFNSAQELGWDDANLEFNIGVALVNLRREKSGYEHIKASNDKTKHPDTWQAYFDPLGH